MIFIYNQWFIEICQIPRHKKIDLKYITILQQDLF